MQPIDSAWNVAKGEAFHPSVAGYMERSKPSPNRFPFTVNRRIQRPTADFENRISGKDEGFEGDEERGLASRVDDTQDVQRLAQGGYLGRRPASHVLRRSSDTPIDSAWNLLKAYGTANRPLPPLSREDLEEASRTGGMARMPGTMRPEIGRGSPGHRAPMIGEMNQPPAYDEGSEMMQEYNELIHPEEEAEHHRINAPTPLRAPVMRVNRKTRERLMVPGAPMPVGEAGEASMDDPSQMEHLGRELADAHHEDIDPTADIPLRFEPPNFPNFRTLQARAPNRTAYMQRR